MTDFASRPVHDMQLRSGGDGRTLSGLLVPFDTPTVINPSLTEMFVRGTFAKQVRAPGRIPLAMNHIPLGGEIIGKVLSLREDTAGLYGEARISDTRAGNDAMELLRDGAMDSLSIGFVEGQNQYRDGVTTRRTATMTELAIVNRPAYPQARVQSLRAACPECGQAFADDHPGLPLPEESRSNSELAAIILAELRPLPILH